MAGFWKTWTSVLISEEVTETHQIENACWKSANFPCKGPNSRHLGYKLCQLLSSAPIVWTQPSTVPTLYAVFWWDFTYKSRCWLELDTPPTHQSENSVRHISCTAYSLKWITQQAENKTIHIIEFKTLWIPKEKEVKIFGRKHKDGVKNVWSGGLSHSKNIFCTSLWTIGRLQH